MTAKFNANDLVSVTYISHSLIKDEDVEDVCTQIREISSKNNAEKEISGRLLYCQHRFVQTLEGENALIDELIATIKSDSRHRNFTILHYGSITSRQFEDWSNMEVITKPEKLIDLNKLFLSLESKGREVANERESKFILNFIQQLAS